MREVEVRPDSAQKKLARMMPMAQILPRKLGMISTLNSTEKELQPRIAMSAGLGPPGMAASWSMISARLWPSRPTTARVS